MADRGGKPVRLRDVARVAGVSQGTASNVFNHPELVRDEVQERVRAAARALGYAGPSAAGRLLRAGKVNAIGVAETLPLTYFFEDPWARAILAALSRVCDERGAGVALVSAANPERVAWNMDSALVDGFVLLCIKGEGELLVRLARRRGLPFVALSPERSEPTLPALLVDNRAGARAAARHLADLGHRQVGVLALDLAPAAEGPLADLDLGSVLYSTARERLLGYREGLGEEAHASVRDVGDDGGGTDAALGRLFAEAEDPPTALLAMSDLVALRAMAWLGSRGLRVPGDVSVVGFDGTPEAAAAAPPLTTVAQPFAAIARRAVAAILDDAMPQAPETMPLDLLVRGSTAPPRS